MLRKTHVITPFLVSLLVVSLTQSAHSRLEDFDANVIQQELENSLQRIRSVYDNCSIRFRSQHQNGDGETAWVEKTFASRGLAKRLDSQSRLESQTKVVSCMNSERVSFVASKPMESGEFVVNAMASEMDVSSGIFNSGEIASAIFGNGPFAFADFLGNPEVKITSSRKFDDDGSSYWAISFESTLRPGEFDVLLQFLGNVWVVKEYSGPFKVHTRSYSGQHNGIPLISKLISKSADPDSENSIEKITEVLEFNPSPPPPEYFTLEGLDISIKKKTFPVFWLSSLGFGVLLLWATTKFRRSDQ